MKRERSGYRRRFESGASALQGGPAAEREERYEALTNLSGVTISSAALTRAWVGVFAYLVLVSLIGAVAIPADAAVAIRWSWGDWTPVDHASKTWALSLVPLVAAFVAMTAIGRRRATDLEFTTAPFAWAEILAMFVLVTAHSVIVLVAI